MSKHVKIVEAIKLTESKIVGIAAFPRLSRNNIFYPPSELAKLHGKTVPILWSHQGTPEQKNDVIPEDKKIGEATVYWDSVKKQLKYEGKIKEEFYQFVKQNADMLQVSIGAHYVPVRVCAAADCFEAATNINLEEISLTPDAGMPETKVKLIEATPDVCLHCEFVKEYSATKSPLEKVIEALDPISRMKLQSYIN